MNADVRVTFCGVRGSTAAPGPEFVQYGGNTSCVAIGPAAGPPTLLLDAGTGIRRVTSMLDGPFQGAVMITHLHWDHFQGLPFFQGADREGAQTELVLPAQAGVSAAEICDRAMSPPVFPIGIDGMNGKWAIHDTPDGLAHWGGYSVLAKEIPHKGGRTLGFRIETANNGPVLAYLPDHGPLERKSNGEIAGVLHDNAMELCEGAALLIHGGTFAYEESELALAFGHSTIDYALELADAARVQQLAITHHSPSRHDDALDGLAARYGNSSVSFAREAAMVDLVAGKPAQQVATRPGVHAGLV